MKIAFTAAHNQAAQQALTTFTNQYGQSSLKNADVVVSLGGDGHVLRMLYDAMKYGKPVFAMRRTESVGFLCNAFRVEDLPERLQKAQSVTLRPLSVTATALDGKTYEALAINEVTVIRETAQAARLSITIDGTERISQFSGDGILVATPAGSTAYNHSCGGPIVPLDSNTLVMTAISGYRPRGWSHAVLPQTVHIQIKALETHKRPVRIEAGSTVIVHAQEARIWLDPSNNFTLLFDPEQHLGERIIREQFML